jgi:4-amino-4-deoxy-L-arabinose transferase-like glycosyltransferase
MTTSSRRFFVALTLISVGALAIRVAYVLLVDPAVPRIGDASAYHLLAEHLARGDGYIRPFDYLLLHKVRATAEYPPLFAVVVAIPARLGVHSVEGQRLFVSLIGAGTVALVGLLGRRVGTPAVGLVAAGLAAISPMLFQSEGMLMAEAIYVPLVVVVLLLAYRAYDAPSVVRFAWLGVAIGFATLARAEGFVLGLILVIPLCFMLSNTSARARAGRGAVAIGVAVLVLAPWTIRNAVHFHAFVPVSNNVATLVDGANCDSTYSGQLLGLWRETFSEYGDRARTLPQAQACFEGFDIADPHFDEAAVADKHRKDGLSYAAHHLSEQPKVMSVRVLRTWALYAPRQQINFETLEGRPKEWQTRGTILFWITLPFAIAGLVLLIRRRVQVWPLASTLVTVTVMAAVTYGQQRFRVAAEPAVYVLAAVGMVALVGALRRTPSNRRVPAPAE